MPYVCSFIHYLQKCSDVSFSRNDWLIPIPDGYSQPLPATGPSFDLWVASPDASEVYRPVADPPEDPHFQPDLSFIDDEDA